MPGAVERPPADMRRNARPTKAIGSVAGGGRELRQRREVRQDTVVMYTVGAVQVADGEEGMEIEGEAKGDLEAGSRNLLATSLDSRKHVPASAVPAFFLCPLAASKPPRSLLLVARPASPPHLLRLQTSAVSLSARALSLTP